MKLYCDYTLALSFFYVEMVVDFIYLESYYTMEKKKNMVYF